MAIEAPVTIPAEVTISGANTYNAGTASDLGKGYITRVVIVCTKANPPHGRYYGQVVLSRGSSVSDVSSVLWSGYVCIPQMIGSIPNVRLYGGERIYFQVFAGRNGASGDQMVANITIEQEPTPGCFLFNEAPGSGPGDIATIALAQPAAGANYANVTVGSRSAERALSWIGTLTASATAANRVPGMSRQNSLGTAYQIDVAPVEIQASIAVTVAGCYGGPQGAQNLYAPATGMQVNFALSDFRLPQGFVFGFYTLNMQTGDQWGAGQLLLECWAMPEGG